MKLNIKSLIVGGLLFLGVLSSSGQVVSSFSMPSGATAFTNLLNVGTRITKITINNVGATNISGLKLLNAPATDETKGYTTYGITNLVPYTAIGRYTTNITTTVTNYYGVIFTNVFIGAQFTYTETLPGYTNNWGVIYTGTVAANTSVEITFPGTGYPANYGLSWTNAAGNTATSVLVEHYPNL